MQDPVSGWRLSNCRRSGVTRVTCNHDCLVFPMTYFWLVLNKQEKSRVMTFSMDEQMNQTLPVKVGTQKECHSAVWHCPHWEETPWQPLTDAGDCKTHHSWRELVLTNTVLSHSQHTICQSINATMYNQYVTTSVDAHALHAWCQLPKRGQTT